MSRGCRRPPEGEQQFRRGDLQAIFVLLRSGLSGCMRTGVNANSRSSCDLLGGIGIPQLPGGGWKLPRIDERLSAPGGGQAQCGENQRKSRRRLPAAGVIEEVSGKRRTPVLEHAGESPLLEMR